MLFSHPDRMLEYDHLSPHTSPYGIMDMSFHKFKLESLYNKKKMTVDWHLESVNTNDGPNEETHKIKQRNNMKLMVYHCTAIHGAFLFVFI